MIKEGIEKEGVSRTFLCLDLAHQAVAASAGLLSRRPCPGSCLDNYLCHKQIVESHYGELLCCSSVPPTSVTL